MTKRSTILRFIIKEYFDGSLDKVLAATGYTKAQVAGWQSGQTEPQSGTIEYLLHRVFTPEFRVIAEYAKFDPEVRRIRAQLQKILEGHETRSGIYAFYDSMVNLVYLGKASNLLDECYQQIRAAVDVSFPKGAKKKPTKRYHVVRYVSAYDVGSSNIFDYPKHVESLILRISKPVLNKNIGDLEKAYVAPHEG